MKQLKFKTKKFQNGITLIALVITIIVLLILAGVSIATLTGENGILTRANEAKENTEQAEENELRKLTQAEAATYLEEHEYTDVSGETVTIPAKCAVSLVEGENTLEDGLVIIDANGNEWVWIEVPESVTVGSVTDDEIESALISYATLYRDSSYLDTWYEGCGLEEQEYADRYSEMLQSIKANNGFFVGRYEVGSFDNPVSAEDTTRKAVIQKGAYPYNYVTCSQAEDLAEGLATEGHTSTLMFGIQWDLVLKYLETKGVPISELKNDSGLWGNYMDVEFPVEQGNQYSIYNDSTLGKWAIVPENYTKPSFDTDGNGVLLSTGATERNSKMNIYDLAGNVNEWTLEKSSNNSRPCTRRGANFSHRSSNNLGNPVYFRWSNITSDSFSSSGFRPALY